MQAAEALTGRETAGAEEEEVGLWRATEVEAQSAARQEWLVVAQGSMADLGEQGERCVAAGSSLHVHDEDDDQGRQRRRELRQGRQETTTAAVAAAWRA